MNIYTKTKNISNVLSSLLGQSKNLRKNYPSGKSLSELIIKHYSKPQQKPYILAVAATLATTFKQNSYLEYI